MVELYSRRHTSTTLSGQEAEGDNIGILYSLLPTFKHLRD